jgi:hypothetical protein
LKRLLHRLLGRTEAEEPLRFPGYTIRDGRWVEVWL